MQIVPIKLLRLGDLHKAAEIHHAHPVAQEADGAQVMRDHHQRESAAIFEIDQPVPAGVIEKLKEVPHVIGVVYYEKEGD